MVELTTSLAEIRSFSPCSDGWHRILCARAAKDPDAIYATRFPLVECLESNSIADVCWLLGLRKTEIAICGKFARMCADSVAHLGNDSSRLASTYAAHAQANVDAGDAYAAATNAARTAHAAYAATNADAYADAYAYADADAADAADADADAAAKQQAKNKQFLVEAIRMYENGEL